MRTRTRRAVDRFNACVLGLRSSPRFGKAVSRSLTVVTYTRRRSGTTFSIPVGYRRAGDVVRIGVRVPDAKGWWRNAPDQVATRRARRSARRPTRPSWTRPSVLSQ
jgi:hypothetical protein